MTLKSCLGIADILKATEKTVHTQLSDKSVKNHNRFHGIFLMIFFALHAFANSIESECFVKHFQNSWYNVFIFMQLVFPSSVLSLYPNLILNL